jgi:hypothetical protein
MLKPCRLQLTWKATGLNWLDELASIADNTQLQQFAGSPSATLHRF